MKKSITQSIVLLLLLISNAAFAATYTSAGTGDWRTTGTWSPATVPLSGSSAANQNIIIIQAGHTVTISGDVITLSNVVIYIYGRLIMGATLGLPPTYANLNITGAGSGVILPPGGGVIEDALFDGNLNIRVGGVVVWNGSSDGDVTAGGSSIYLPAGINNPLPIVLTHWNVEATGQGMKASWTTSSESNNDYFTLEESENGIDFYILTEIDAHGNSSGLQNYTHFFQTNGSGTLYYRLKQTDLDGTFTYSAIVSLSVNAAQTSLSVFPNPVTGNEFTVHTQNKVNVLLLLDSRTGQEIFRQDISHLEEASIRVTLPEQVKAGLYLLSIQHTEGVETKTVMVY